jgi:hypothetical protein
VFSEQPVVDCLTLIKSVDSLFKANLYWKIAFVASESEGVTEASLIESVNILATRGGMSRSLIMTEKQSSVSCAFSFALRARFV